MTDDIQTTGHRPAMPLGPAARRRAQRAAAAKRSQSIAGRLTARFRKPEVRRRGAMILLLTCGALIAWNVLGQDAPKDVASSLSRVTDAARDRSVAEAPAPLVPVMAADPMDAAALPGLPALPRSPVAAAAPDMPPAGELSSLRETQARAGEGACVVSVEAMPLAAATIALDLSSPCDKGVRVDLIQGDLQVAVRLSDTGTATVEMPALSAAPTVAVLVTDRDPVMIQTEAVDIDRYHRVVLHWQGAAALELHAFEGGATYGDDGHVGPDAPRTIAHALSGNGGFLTSVGDADLPDSRTAQIYTVPMDMTADLSIEALVTAENCAQPVYAGTIQIDPGIPAAAQDIALTMPACDAVGDYILLGSLMRPITVASN